MKQDILKVDALTKYYEFHQVINHLSFRIRRGQRMALYAPSGAGKTTLIKILAGLETYDGGRFEYYDAIPMTLFQEPRLFAYMTVEENILLPFRLHKITPSSDLWRHYQNWLEVCELGAYAQHFPWQLSGGMKQKVALIRGLLGKPAFVMMDEPFQSIGQEAKRTIIDHIKSTQPDLTTLFVTHIASEVPLLADSVLYFQESVLENPFELAADEFHLSLPDIISAKVERKH